MEARHRDALTQAITSGANLAIDTAQAKAKEIDLDEVLAYAKNSVPDAIKHFNPTNWFLQEKAAAEVSKALAARNMQAEIILPTLLIEDKSHASGNTFESRDQAISFVGATI